MVNEKIRRELRGLYESDIDFDTSDGNSLYVYLYKTHRNGEVKWRLDKISDTIIEIGDEFDEVPQYKQIVLNCEIDIRPDSRKYCNLVEAEKVDQSDVVKLKSQLKNYIVELWKVCFPYRNLPSEDRLPEADDFKVTTVWGDGKAGHMGTMPHSSEKNYKLGVDWRAWHRRDSENRVRFLTHEMTHIIHSHHRSSFFEKHTKAVQNLISSSKGRDMVTSWFGNIDWNRLKALTLEGPHKQSKEIMIGDSKNRREACCKVVDRMEDILDYDYQTARRFHISPPLKEIKRGYIRNLDENDYSIVDVDELSHSDNHSDEELNEIINHNLTAEDYGFDYGVDQIPHISNSKDVKENGYFIELMRKMRLTIYRNKPKSMKSDDTTLRIPVVED